MARLFFALWPPAAARERLGRIAAELARRCSGRAVPAGKAHLTLAFLGEVDPAGEARAAEVAARIIVPALDLAFDRVGSFARARVAWAGASRPDASADRLAADLAWGLRDAGFALDRRPFVAHVTLVRRIRRRCPEAPLEPAVRWTADRLVLVESDLRTGRYVEKGSWGGTGAR